MYGALSLFEVGDCLSCFTVSKEFFAQRQKDLGRCFSYRRSFPFALSLNPAGFSLAFAALGAC